MELKLIDTEPERIALCADLVEDLTKELNDHYDGKCRLFRFYSGGRRLRFQAHTLEDVGVNSLLIKGADPTRLADAVFGIRVQGIKKEDLEHDSYPGLRIAAEVGSDTLAFFALLRFDRILGTGRGVVCEEHLPLLVPPFFRLRVREFAAAHFRHKVIFHTTGWPQPTLRRAL